jgi:hypothetical protein
MMAGVVGRKPGTLRCILCRGVVQYRDRDEAKFVKHMENEHGAYFDLDLILATCFMDQEEKQAVRMVIESKDVDDGEEEGENESTVQVKQEQPEEDEPKQGLKRSLEEPEEERPAKSRIVSADTFGCAQCDQRFQQAERLRIHVKTTHTQLDVARKTEFHCEECDQYFSRKDALRIHRQRRHNEPLTRGSPDGKRGSPDVKPGSPVGKHGKVCQECKAVFSTSGNLKKHERKFHTDQWKAATTNEFSCQVCDIKYSSVAALANHNKWKHGDIPNATDLPLEQPRPEAERHVEAPLQCTACDKTFTRRDNLNKHIKVFHGRRDHVEQHMEKEHGGGSPLKPPSSPPSPDQAEPTSPKPEPADSPEEEADPGQECHVQIEKSKYFRLNSYAVQPLEQYTDGTESDFRACAELPAGWRLRYCGPADQPEKATHFICPGPVRRVIKSRLGAIELLRLAGAHSRDQLWHFATNLHVPEKRFNKLF